MMQTIIKACLSFGTQYYTLSQVVDATGLQRETVRHRLWKLESAGLITRIKYWESPLPGFSNGRPTKNICYRSTQRLFEKANAPKAHKYNSWDAMWKTIRALRKFTRSDLQIICSQGLSNVQAFTKTYRKLGYIKPLREKGRNILWMLIKDPGPRRPLFSSII
jgi:DNA-binding Lrp family transcriptional regulator